jgi:hypothetical protein
MKLHAKFSPLAVENAKDFAYKSKVRFVIEGNTSICTYGNLVKN